MIEIRTVCFFVGALLFPVLASADDLVTFPSGDSSWTVTYAPAAPGPMKDQQAGTLSPGGQKEDVPVKVEVTRVGNNQRIRITWTDGKSSEQWSAPKWGVVFKEDPRNGSVFPVMSGHGEMQSQKAEMPYEQSSFSWLSPGSLQEKDPIQYNNKECFHYLINGPAASSGKSHLGVSNSASEAWIDSKTLLPVAIHIANILATFTFADKPPTEPLTPPEKFLQEMDYYRRVMGYSK